MSKQKHILITISEENGDNKQFSAFSNNKIEYITNTKQWEYVLNEIIQSFENRKANGHFMRNPNIDGYIEENE